MFVLIVFNGDVSHLYVLNKTSVVAANHSIATASRCKRRLLSCCDLSLVDPATVVSGHGHEMPTATLAQPSPYCIVYIFFSIKKWFLVIISLGNHNFVSFLLFFVSYISLTFLLLIYQWNFSAISDILLIYLSLIYFVHIFLWYTLVIISLSNHIFLPILVSEVFFLYVCFYFFEFAELTVCWNFKMCRANSVLYASIWLVCGKYLSRKNEISPINMLNVQMWDFNLIWLFKFELYVTSCGYYIIVGGVKICC